MIWGTRERLWQRLRQGVALLLCGVVIWLILATPVGVQLRALWRDPNPEHFQQWLETGTLWVPLVLILCMIAHTLMPLPAELLAVAAGALLGVFWGFLTIWIGAMLGAYFGFFLARSFGQGLVQRLAHGQRLQRLQGWLQRPDIRLLLAVRLVPVISFNLVNFALGCTKVGWWRFTWTTGLGIVPVTAAMVGLGAHLHNWRVMLVLSLAALVVALGGYWVLRACSIPSVARVSSGANPLTERRVSPLGSEGGGDDAPND